MEYIHFFPNLALYKSNSILTLLPSFIYFPAGTKTGIVLIFFFFLLYSSQAEQAQQDTQTSKVKLSSHLITKSNSKNGQKLRDSKHLANDIMQVRAQSSICTQNKFCIVRSMEKFVLVYYMPSIMSILNVSEQCHAVDAGKNSRQNQSQYEQLSDANRQITPN